MRCIAGAVTSDNRCGLLQGAIDPTAETERRGEARTQSLVALASSLRPRAGDGTKRKRNCNRRARQARQAARFALQTRSASYRSVWPLFTVWNVPMSRRWRRITRTGNTAARRNSEKHQSHQIKSSDSNIWAQALTVSPWLTTALPHNAALSLAFQGNLRCPAQALARREPGRRDATKPHSVDGPQEGLGTEPACPCWWLHTRRCSHRPLSSVSPAGDIYRSGAWQNKYALPLLTSPSACAVHTPSTLRQQDPAANQTISASPSAPSPSAREKTQLSTP